MKKLINILKHPILYWKSWRRRNLPVIDLDNPENNCEFCGYDHHAIERLETK